jgi:50S ribosomal subunit-associated GTPase HflX
MAKVMIVGNKTDLVDPGGEVELMARAFARERGYSHHTVSAKTGEGIDAVFEDLLGSIIREPHTPTAPPIIEVGRDSSCSGGARCRVASKERVNP